MTIQNNRKPWFYSCVFKSMIRKGCKIWKNMHYFIAAQLEYGIIHF